MQSRESSCLIKQQFDYSNFTGLPDRVESTWIACAILNGLAIPSITFLNLLVISIILKDKTLRTVTYNVLLVMLAGSDLLTGLSVIPIYLWKVLFHLLHRVEPCIDSYYGISAIVCCFLSLSSLTATTVERYIAIEYGQFHIERVTSKKAIFANILSWAGMLAVGFPGVIILTQYSEILQKIPVGIVTTVYVLVIIYCTTKVYLTASRQRRRVSAQSKAVQREERERMKEVLRDYKRAVNTVILVVSTFLLYCPLIIVIIIQLFVGNITADFVYTAFYIGLTFSHLQSLVNPVIMALRLSHIRKEVKKLLFCDR